MFVIFKSLSSFVFTLTTSLISILWMIINIGSKIIEWFCPSSKDAWVLGRIQINSFNFHNNNSPGRKYLCPSATSSSNPRHIKWQVWWRLWHLWRGQYEGWSHYILLSSAATLQSSPPWMCNHYHHLYVCVSHVIDFTWSKQE